MKNIHLSLMALVLFVLLGSCTGTKKIAETKVVHEQYGEQILPTDYISFAEMLTVLEKEGTFTGKVKGTVVSVCQKKGCWMTMNAGSDTNELFVKFKDYGFFMPFDLSGKEVVVRGSANKETTSVDMLRHYATDGGATEEEANKITEPETAFNFMADGVVVVK